MYLVVIAWIYVVLLMSVAEATNTTGTVLGAVVTFVMYGLGPCALVVYLMRTPARNKAGKLRRAEELARHQAQSAVPAESPANPLQPALPTAESATSASLTSASISPDGSRHAASGAEAIALEPGIAPVRKEP